jgi:hypothetical protein
MFSASALDALAAKYRRGDTILVKVPLMVSPMAERSREETFFHVVLRRDLADRGAAPAFVRNGIQIRPLRGESAARASALVVIEDHDPEASRDAETPVTLIGQKTHRTSETSTAMVPPRSIVRRPPFIAETLAESSRERDLLSLADFFRCRATIPPATPAPRRASKKSLGHPLRPMLSPAGIPKVERVQGRFRISSITAPKQGVFVAVAYDCTRAIR